MINVIPEVQAFARPFTEVNDHPIIWQDPAGDLDDDELTSRVTQKVTREMESLIRGQNNDVNMYTIYSFFESCPFVCPNCSELIEGLDYSSNVREYGSVSLNLSGVDDYNSHDSETQDTDFFCPECNDQVNESNIAILCSRGGVQVVNNFVTTLLEGRHGPVNITGSANMARNVFYATPFMQGAAVRPGAIATLGVATNCDASVPIATEDIAMGQDLFDN